MRYIILVVVLITIIVFILNCYKKKRKLTVKDITKLRQQLKLYDVQSTQSLFGKFAWDWNGAFKVMARSPLEAVMRSRRRGWGSNMNFEQEICTEMWAKYRVKLSNATDKYKNITYLR